MRLTDVIDVLRALEREGVQYAIFGGVAMAIHGLDRGTEDLDLFLAADADNVDRLRKALRSVYSDPSIEDITAEDLVGDYPAVRYGPPDVEFTIDVVTRLGEAFAFSDLELERVRLSDVEVAVVTPRTLYAMKRNTVRPRDADDAARLRSRFDVEA